MAAPLVAIPGGLGIGQGGGGGAPPPVDAPQLPFAAEPGSITGWMLEMSAADTTRDIAEHMRRSFEHLGSLPAVANAGYDAARQRMLEEVVSADALDTYLVMSNTPIGSHRVTVIHCKCVPVCPNGFHRVPMCPSMPHMSRVSQCVPVCPSMSQSVPDPIECVTTSTNLVAQGYGLKCMGTHLL